MRAVWDLEAMAGPEFHGAAESSLGRSATGPKETRGHCSQGHLAPADYDASPFFSLLISSAGSPGTGTALPLQVFPTHSLRSPAIYQLCGKLVHLCLNFLIYEMGLIFVRIS